MIDPEITLSPAVEDMITTLLGGGRRTPPLDDDARRRFALGITEEDELEDVLEAIVSSPEEQVRIMQLHDELEQLSRTPLTGGSWLAALVGQVIDRQTRPESSVGLRERLAAICRSMTLATAIPSLATSRAAMASDHPSVFGEGVNVDLDVEIRDNGSLHAEAHLNVVKGGGKATDFDGRELTLTILDPAGGQVPVGSSRVANGIWSLDVADFQAATRLSGGAVDRSFFQLVPPAGRASSPSGNRLYVEVENQSPTTVDLVEEPRLVGGVLIVTLGMSEAKRAEFANYDLELAIPVGSHLQTLGRWPMSEWGKDLRTFRCPISETGEGRAAIGSLLHVRLKLV